MDFTGACVHLHAVLLLAKAKTEYYLFPGTGVLCRGPRALCPGEGAHKGPGGMMWRYRAGASRVRFPNLKFLVLDFRVTALVLHD